MTDCENYVFTKLKTAILAKYPNAEVASEYISAPSKFPHIAIVMSDCYTPTRYLTMSATEETTACNFEINVYSNKAGTKKSECKAISQIINKEMYTMNFIRTAQTPVPNLENNSIYRIVSRYNGVLHKDYIYRR